MKMSISNEVADVVGKTSVGVTGGVASVWMNGINEYVSFFVGIATLIFLIISIWVKLQDHAEKKEG
jgi:hypothetical protein